MARMNQLSHEEELMVRYLLGDLPEAAQAQIEGLPIISNDLIFDDYAVSRIW